MLGRRGRGRGEAECCRGVAQHTLASGRAVDLGNRVEERLPPPSLGFNGRPLVHEPRPRCLAAASSCRRRRGHGHDAHDAPFADLRIASRPRVVARRRRRSVDGVFGLWYGKGPGVDRSGDAIKHGNMYGSSPHGGVLMMAGDDHGCVSSTISHQSEYGFIGASLLLVLSSCVGVLVSERLAASCENVHEAPAIPHIRIDVQRYSTHTLCIRTVTHICTWRPH